jgi:hypothetical protein
MSSQKVARFEGEFYGVLCKMYSNIFAFGEGFTVVVLWAALGIIIVSNLFVLGAWVKRVKTELSGRRNGQKGFVIDFTRLLSIFHRKGKL